jgi:hypothetical protein
MFWMLREAGASYAEIARAADLSVERVRQICRGYGYQLHRRSEYTSEEPFMARLRRAGALLGVAERVGGAIGGPQSSCARAALSRRRRADATGRGPGQPHDLVRGVASDSRATGSG